MKEREKGKVGRERRREEKRRLCHISPVFFDLWSLSHFAGFERRPREEHGLRLAVGGAIENVCSLHTE